MKKLKIKCFIVHDKKNVHRIFGGAESKAESMK